MVSLFKFSPAVDRRLQLRLRGREAVACVDLSGDKVRLDRRDLLLQGIDDDVVKVNLTDDFVNKMVAAGADLEYVRIHGRHGVAFDLNLNVTRPAMDNFFERYLKK